jgi:hypothetical protein
MVNRLTWPQIQRSDEYRGRWIALGDCRYDAKTARPVEGIVVDADEDLAELCNRLQREEGRHCAVVFCGEEVDSRPVSRPSRPVSRPHAVTH